METLNIISPDGDSTVITSTTNYLLDGNIILGLKSDYNINSDVDEGKKEAEGTHDKFFGQNIGRVVKSLTGNK